MNTENKQKESLLIRLHSLMEQRAKAEPEIPLRQNKAVGESNPMPEDPGRSEPESADNAPPVQDPLSRPASLEGFTTGEIILMYKDGLLSEEERKWVQRRDISKANSKPLGVAQWMV